MPLDVRSKRPPNRVFLLASDRLGGVMAGSGVRYTEFAQALATRFSVTLVTTNREISTNQGIRSTPYPGSRASRIRLLDSADVIVVQAFSSLDVPRSVLTGGRHVIVVDLYCPYWLENGIAAVARHSSSPHQHRMDIATLRDQLRIGDFFLCASTRQRDMLIGLLAVVGRLTPSLLERDPTLSTLIGVVPFGMPRDPFPATGASVHELIPGLSLLDRVVVWGGGIHDWLDVETPIRAMELLRERHPEIKLLFATTASHPDHKTNPTAERAQNLARAAGLLGSTVLFLEGWTPYSQRANYLRGATAGIVSHANHVETRFAFRTRVLDYLWAGIPIIISDGDELAEVVRTNDLGIVVPPGEPASLAEAFVQIIERVDRGEPFTERIARVRPHYYWEKVTEALVDFCANPQKSTQLGDPVLLDSIKDVMSPRREVTRLAFRFVSALQHEGIRAVMQKFFRTMRTSLGRL